MSKGYYECLNCDWHGTAPEYRRCGVDAHTGGYEVPCCPECQRPAVGTPHHPDADTARAEERDHFTGEDIALYALSMLAEDYGFDPGVALHNALTEMNEARAEREAYYPPDSEGGS